MEAYDGEVMDVYFTDFVHPVRPDTTERSLVSRTTRRPVEARLPPGHDSTRIGVPEPMGARR